MLKNIFTAACCVTFLNCYSQISFDTVFTKTYGAFSHREAISAIELSDDSFLISTAFHGGSNFCDWHPELLLANKNGDTIWSKRGLAGDGKIIKTSDNAFLNIRKINTPSNCALDTILISKFNLSGDSIWTKKFFFGKCNNTVTDIEETNDAGFILTVFYSNTSCSSPFYTSSLIKLRDDGATQWIKNFGDSTASMQIISLAEATDGSFGILGFSAPNEYRMIKTDLNGDSLWQKSIYDSNFVSGKGDIALLPNDEFLIAGTLGTNVFLSKISTDGSIKFLKKYPPSVAGNIGSIQNIKYIPAIRSYLLASDKFMIIDTLGEVQWKSQSFNAVFKEVMITTSGDIFSVGFKLVNSKEKIFLSRLVYTGSKFSSRSISLCAGDSIFLEGDFRNSAGIYYDTLHASNNVDSIIINTLSITNINTHVFASGDTLVSAAVAEQYNWINCMNDIVTDSGKNFIPEKSGMYAVQIFSKGCIDTSACISFSITTSNLDSENFPEEIYVSQTADKILVHQPNSCKACILEMYSIHGQLINKTDLLHRIEYISTDELPAGAYFLNIRHQEKKMFSKKVVLTH